MLDKFRKAKAAEIERLLRADQDGAVPAPRDAARPSFADALRGEYCAVIAEYKRASPSKGEINLRFTPEEIAAAYARGGAAAVSVLTEEVYFKGALDYLEPMRQSGLPLLRKDFILHPLQVRETAATCASALLLIARMLDNAELRALLDLTNALGMQAVVEAFDENDLARALAAEPTIIQINNRDLDTLNTDLAVSERLINRKRPGQVWISASGIYKRGEIERLADMGYDACLIGTSIMSENDPGRALAKLTGKAA